MKRVSLTVEPFERAPFNSAGLAALGAWTKLQVYCTKHVNSGWIAGCKVWNERAWMCSIGLTPDEAQIAITEGLAFWDGDSLRVLEYDQLSEAEYLRQVARAAAARSRKPAPAPKPGSLPCGSTPSSPLLNDSIQDRSFQDFSPDFSVEVNESRPEGAANGSESQKLAVDWKQEAKAAFVRLGPEKGKPIFDQHKGDYKAMYTALTQELAKATA